ncbi:winged helix-turn-helix transcriptional regulator [Pendulispora albinea]|uniref:Helix-turn-helix transcriptional regulator n=1 Tax=Pendulispora albinea TaxID=2741071 RepID=A0ABZ2M191_9BACT
MRRKSLEGAVCPVARSLDAIGDWWSLLIVRDAIEGVQRFGEFQRSLGLAKSILATRLRLLMANGILEHVPSDDGGAHGRYVLTEKGRGLFHVIVALRQWGEHHWYEPGEPRSVFLLDRTHGRPVRTLELRSEDDRVLGADDVQVVKKRLPPASAPASSRRRRKARMAN